PARDHRGHREALLPRRLHGLVRHDRRHHRSHRRLPSPQFAREIYGDPAAVTGGYALPAGSALPVEGGLLVNGRWAWGSGLHHCTWIGGGCWVVDERGERAARPDDLAAPFVFFERSQVELLDTWRVAGLRGTGSTDYEVRDALVPEGRWVQLPVGQPQVDSP